MPENGTTEEKREMLEICACPGCPSWAECGEKGGFCLSLVGKSGCITKENGCICGGCSVHAMLGFKNHYYCTKGPEKGREKR